MSACDPTDIRSNPMTSLRQARLLLAAAVLLVLAGCLSLGDKGSVTVHAPRVPVAVNPEWPKVSWSLVVIKPLASEALDSPGIVVRPLPGTLQVYKGAVWSDPVPDLLHTQLVRAFEDSGKIIAVGRQASGVRGDFALLLDVRQFESVYGDPAQPPAVTIEIQAKLLTSPNNRVVASKTFLVAVPAADAKMPAVIAAFETAMSQALSGIVGWTLVSGQANPPGAAPAR